MEGFLHYLFTRPGLDYPFGHTAARFPFFILANAAMFAVSRRIAERLVPNEDSGARTIATLQIFVSHIILQLLILQLLPLPARFSDSFFYSLIISAAEYAAIAFLLPKKQGGGAPAEATPASRITWLPAAVLFVVISAGALWALITPPPFSDAFLDHLAYPAHWLQDEAIRRVPNYFHDRSTPYYPGNAWLLYLWVLAPFSSDALTNFTHFASLLFICFIVHTTVARSGVNRFSANAAAAACLCFPFVFIFALGSEIDMFFTLFFALAAFWAWRARTGPHSAPALFLGWCALALMCGTKHLGIAYSIPLIPFLIPNIKLFSETHQTEKCAKVLGKRCGEQPFYKRFFSANIFFQKSLTVFAAAVSLLALGGWWYIWNFSDTGNPFYPLQVRFGNLTVFPGEYSSAAFAATPYHASGFGGFIKTVTALAPPYALIVLCAAALIAMASDIRGLIKRRTAAIAALPVAVTLLFWFANSHNNYECARLLMPALFCIIAAPFLCRGKTAALMQWIVFAGCAILLFVDPNVKPFDYFIYFSNKIYYRPLLDIDFYYMFLMISAPSVLFVTWLQIRKTGALKIILFILFLSAASFYVLLFDTINNENAIRMRYSWYNPVTNTNSLWDYLDCQYSKGATIAVTGTSMTYGYMGSRLQNHVVYVSPSGGETGAAALPHKIERGRALELDPFFAQSRWHPSAEAWLRGLKESGAQFLVIESLHQYQIRHEFPGRNGFPVELKLAEESPEIFVPDHSFKKEALLFHIKNGTTPPYETICGFTF